MSVTQLAVALLCIHGELAAARASDRLETSLRSYGDVILDTTILQIDEKHKVPIYDPHRVLMGILTPALTWGPFGLLAGTDRVESALIWAAISAICGGLYAYFSEHTLTKTELTRIGRQLPATSSALLTYAETGDPQRLLQTTTAVGASVASVAAIGDDLTVRVLAGSADPVEVPSGSSDGNLPYNQMSLLSMILVRYHDLATARRVASGLTRSRASGESPPQVELVIETDRGGHRHVANPRLGVAAMAKSDVIIWGLFGLVTGGGVGPGSKPCAVAHARGMHSFARSGPQIAQRAALLHHAGANRDGADMIGNFLIIDLIAATTNAFNGALLARQPSHYRKYTVVGIMGLAIVIGIIGATAGRYLLDITSGVTPLQFIKSEWFVGAAVISASVYVFCEEVVDLSIRPATLIAFAFGFAFRLAANYWRWEEPEPWPSRSAEGDE
jgi:hypothetical protein